MKGPLLLAWRYLAHHRARTALTAACVALVTVLPLAVEGLVQSHGARLTARGRSTPLVLGAPGSRFDLVLSALYFRGRPARTLPWSAFEERLTDDEALPVPLHLGPTASGLPLVGTSLDYLEARGLELAAGERPVLVGEALLGSEAARELGLGAGDTLLTDRGSLYDLAAPYPLRLRVTGVLAESGTPDDGAVLCDVRTSWIASGIGHGHRSPDEARESEVLERGERSTTFGPAVVELTEIDAENAAEFHVHGDPGERPLSAVLLFPRDARAATILRGRASARRDLQVVVPEEVVSELTSFVLRLKAFFDANSALVLTATLLFLGLLMSLTVRVRRRELETLARLGCARGTIARILGLELLLTTAGGVLAGSLLAFGLLRFLETALLP